MGGAEPLPSMEGGTPSSHPIPRALHPYPTALIPAGCSSEAVSHCDITLQSSYTFTSTWRLYRQTDRHRHRDGLIATQNNDHKNKQTNNEQHGTSRDPVTSSDDVTACSWRPITVERDLHTTGVYTGMEIINAYRNEDKSQISNKISENQRRIRQQRITLMFLARSVFQFYSQTRSRLDLSRRYNYNYGKNVTVQIVKNSSKQELSEVLWRGECSSQSSDNVSWFFARCKFVT